MRSRGTAAFTMVELLVGMSIVVLLVMLLSRILSDASGMWRRGEANKDRLQNVRAITDFISTELRAAVLPVNRPSATNLQLILNPTSIPEEFKNPDALFWQAPIAPDQTLGDLAEIGYFVRWDESDRSNPRAQLCRFLVGPTDTTNFLIYSSPTAWLSGTILTRVAPAGKNDAYKGLLAENVVGLWIRCLDAEGKEITKDASGGIFTKTFDSRRGYTDSAGAVHSGCALPPVVELSFALIDSGIATRIGPEQKEAITQLSATVTSAADFVNQSAATAPLKSVYQGFRSYQTKIYLQNAK